ncbi:MAG: response regulator [Candidatus Micrarchaeota archaeon]|nr:response regulator [Candidatus Micrarchaeota archaeon]
MALEMQLGGQPNPRGSNSRSVPPSILAPGNLAVAPSLRNQKLLAGANAREFRKMVLLVEDSRNLRLVYAAWMARTGFDQGKILQASDLQEAMAHLSAHAGEIGLVVTDMSYPPQSGQWESRESGIRLIHAVRRMLGESVPILAMSGDEENLPYARQAGADAALSKTEFIEKFSAIALGLIETVH